MKSKIVLLLSTIIISTGCRNTKDLKGQYEGVLIQNDKTTDIVAFVAEKSLKRKHFEVLINELNISAPPVILSFELDRDNELTFTYRGNNYYLEFDKNENCISSVTKNIKFNLCLDKNKLNLKFDDVLQAENSFKLSVTKNGDASAQTAKTRYTVEELLGRAKFLNFTLEQNAENVYRSRQQVKSALGNLLPKLSTGDILGFATEGPVAFVGAVGNLAPFLFPSNWFQFKEAKELNKAELKSYASMRGNILSGVEGLLYVHLRNTSLVEIIEKELEWLQNVLDNVKAKEENGTAPQGTSELLEMKIGSIALDNEQLKLFVEQENSEIAHLVRLPVQSTFLIFGPELPELSQVPLFLPEACLQTVAKSSYELQSLDFLIAASKYQTEERIWSFLDPEGGGIGFGTPSSIRIGQSYERELKLKRDEVHSLLQKGCRDSVNELNTSLKSYKLANQYLTKAQKIRSILAKRILLGDELNESILDDLADNAQEILKYESQKMSAQYEFLISEGKLNRLMLKGFYSNLEVGL